MDERLERVLIRVQNGSTIQRAIAGEGIPNVFYRRFTAAQRAPIVAARREWLARQIQNHSPTSRNFQVYMPSLAHKQAFQAECERDGTTMSRQVVSLIAAYMKQRRAG